MRRNIRRSAALLMSVLLLAALAAGCAGAPGAQETSAPIGESASPSAAPSAPAETALPSASPSPSPSPTPSPSPSPSPTPSASPEPTEAPGEPMEIGADLTAMEPLLEARALLLLNGEDPQTSAGFWHAASFAMDRCGGWFVGGEAVGSALTLPASVLEEIGSGLLEGFSALPQIPDAVAGDVVYDPETDSYTHQSTDSEMPLEIREAAQNADGSVRLSCALAPTGAESDPYRFTFVLAANPRAENTVFVYTVRSVEME